MLKSLLADLRRYSGLLSKKQISVVSSALSDAFTSDYPNGDDTAVVESAQGHNLMYDLIAAEGFLPTFVEKDPWFAGWCGIMVNVSDIAAMGGRPSGIVNTLWGQENEIAEKLLEGMAEASKRYHIPILGGHTNLNCSEPYLGVSIVGKAKKLLSSFAAEPGQSLIAAVDLRAEFRQPFLNWNAATDAPSERLIGDLELLPTIAEAGLAFAAKDVSQAGFLGTALMLIESSQVGAEIKLEQIPKPKHVNWEDWLRAFPSYGYLLTTSSANVDDVLNLFAHRQIDAAEIGQITSDMRLNVVYKNEKETFWDLNRESLTGLTKPHPNSAKKRTLGVGHA